MAMLLTKYKLAYFLMINVFALPLLLITNEFWDASIASYGFRIDDISGIKDMYFQTGWHIQYYLYQIIYTLSGYIGIKEEFIIKIITIFSVIGISQEVKRLCIDSFKIPENIAYIAAYLVLLFPAWFVLVSHVLVIHVLCIYFLLLGYRLVMSKRQYVTGFFLILLSFQLESNFMLIIGLIFTDYMLKKRKHVHIKTSYLILSIITIVFLFILNQNIFGGYGIWKNYNQLQFDSSIIKPAIGHAFNFGVFILTLTAIPFFIFFKQFKKTYNKNDNIAYLMLLLLLICAIFPYVVLGKSPGLFDFYNWFYRQAFLLSIPIPILIAFLYSRMESLANPIENKRPLYLKISLTFILFFSFLYTGFYHKLASEFYQNAIVHSLKKIDQPPKGILGINIKNDITSRYLLGIRFYEYNYLFYKAFGQANWMISNVKRNDLNDIFLLEEVQKKVLSGDLSKVTWVASNAHPNCQTIVQIEQKKEVKFWDVLKNKHEDVLRLKVTLSDGLEC